MPTRTHGYSNEATAAWGAELQSGTQCVGAHAACADLFNQCVGAHAACADCAANQGQLLTNFQESGGWFMSAKEQRNNNSHNSEHTLVPAVRI